MAIPTRIDGAPHRVRTLGRRPIVLARLPHATASNIRVDSELVDFQETGFLEPDGDILANHFVDPGHLENELELPALAESAPEQPVQHSPSRRRKKRSSGSEKSRPITTFRQQSPASEPSTLLFTLHSQLAPFAGAIVALALIASAGLLYWMIVSPNRVSLDFPEEGQVGFEASSPELPKFVPELPSFASRTIGAPASETAAFDLPAWEAEEVVAEESTEVGDTPAMAMQEQELVVSLEETTSDSEPQTEPVPVNALEQAASPVAELNFATTNSPRALDFTKIGVTAEIETQTDSPHGKPVAQVAGRTVPHVSIPIKR